MFKFKQFVEEVESYELTEEDFLTLTEEEKNLYLTTEKISFQLRQKRSRLMKKLRNRLKLGARKAKKKIASIGTLKRRARRTVRRAFAKKLAGGKKITSVGQKDQLFKRLGGKVMQNRMVRKTVPQLKKTRQADKTRKQGGSGRARSG